MALLNLDNESAVPGFRKASRFLAKRDPVMRELVSVIGDCTLTPRRNYFAVLCDSIISQQISVHVARVLFGRFQSLFPNRRPNPQRVLHLTEDTFRAVGISRQKVWYLKDLAKGFMEGRIVSHRLWRQRAEKIENI